jgi:hypothetical protein
LFDLRVVDGRAGGELFEQRLSGLAAVEAGVVRG